jgi:iron(III) transport system permease protein
MTRRVPLILWRHAPLGVIVLVLGAFLVYPIALTVRGGFYDDPAGGAGFTLRHIRMVFADPVLREGLCNSLRIAATTTTLALLLALPPAVLSARCSYPGKAALSALILAPMILPPFVGAIGIRAILGRTGAINALLGTGVDFLGAGRFWGVVAVQALALYPIVYLNAVAALANVDPAMDEAARNLGAGPWRRLLRVTLPLIRPGLFAGATIVFVWSFTELGAPLMFDYYRVTPVQVFNGLKEVENNAQPFALTLVMLVTAVGAYLLGRVVLGGGARATYPKASVAFVERRLTGWRGWAASGFLAILIAVAFIPHAGVVLVSLSQSGQWYGTVLPSAFTPEHYRQALSAADSFGAIRNSLVYASAAVILDVVLGVTAGYLIVRTRLRGRGVLDALCMLPLAVPGLVMAFGYVAVSLRWPFGAGGPLEGLVSVVGANPNPAPLLVIAYAVRRLPYIVRSTAAGLEQTPVDLEEAAVNLGASRVTAVRRVVVPLILANLVAGALLVFSFSMLEVSDSLILAQQSEHYPITRAIFAFSERLGDGMYVAAALGVWGMVLLAVTLAGASLLLGRRLGSAFRA